MLNLKKEVGIALKSKATDTQLEPVRKKNYVTIYNAPACTSDIAQTQVAKCMYK